VVRSDVVQGEAVCLVHHRGALWNVSRLEAHEKVIWVLIPVGGSSSRL
jgi:hypothetical protein